MSPLNKKAIKATEMLIYSNNSGMGESSSFWELNLGTSRNTSLSHEADIMLTQISSFLPPQNIVSAISHNQDINKYPIPTIMKPRKNKRPECISVPDYSS
jgi:hypothetical protein